MPTTTRTIDPIPACPRCRCAHVVRNGKTKAGSANFRCRGCDRCFVADPKRNPITEERKDLVDRLLLERLSLRAISRATGISRSWLQGHVNELYREQTPWEPGELKKSPGR
jgi:transposase-like protein